MVERLTKVLLILLAVAGLGALIWFQQDTLDQPVSATVSAQSVNKAPAQNLNDQHLHDNKLLYANDDDTSVVTMYLTVSRGTAAENTDHTWAEINTYTMDQYDAMGIERYQIAGLLQVGDENGPLPGELGYGEVVPNATVQIRGQTSSNNQQKNYKIEVKKGKGLWNNQRTIALNKHQTEAVRYRNKLAFDLLEGIPQLMSLRTQFVHLYVRDMTGDNPDEFVDYGLYTQVEQLNSRAMKAHQLDQNGHLYKINVFSFEEYEDIRLMTDPLFDQKAFDALLEVKGNTDHSKLIRLLKAINDTSVTADMLFDTYFDLENVSYWMAFQILLGNVDTINRNVYFYSPLNSERWYFIPWDHDGSLMKLEYQLEEWSERGSWQTGVSNYWGNVLFQKLLKSKTYRDALDAAMLDLLSYMSTERLTTMINDYISVVKPYLYNYPDVKYAVSEEWFDAISASIITEVPENYQRYLDSFKRPMPFFISTPVRLEEDERKIRFEWIPSYDFDMEDITYDFRITRDYLMQDVVYEQHGVIFPRIDLELEEPGQYFVYVRATNESGYTQEALDYYVVINEGKHYGMRSFFIMEDGSVETDVYEE